MMKLYNRVGSTILGSDSTVMSKTTRLLSEPNPYLTEDLNFVGLGHYLLWVWGHIDEVSKSRKKLITLKIYYIENGLAKYNTRASYESFINITLLTLIVHKWDEI